MLGRSTFGHDIWINQELFDCDVKVLTGFIEPHFFAGFSGGGKAIMPGMGGQRTVLSNHDARMIANPNSTWGIPMGTQFGRKCRKWPYGWEDFPGQRSPEQA